MEQTADIALIGLAVMGQNLIMNMNDHGYTVVAYNRTTAKVDEFLNDAAKGSKVIGAHSIEEMVKLLKRPRKIMLMVKAGKPVDEFIETLLPYLEPGDLIATGTPAGCALKAPGKLVMFVMRHFMSEATKWKLFIKKGQSNPLFLRPGDVMSASIRTDDGALDLGEQRNRVVGA